MVQHQYDGEPKRTKLFFCSVPFLLYYIYGNLLYVHPSPSPPFHYPNIAKHTIVCLRFLNPFNPTLQNVIWRLRWPHQIIWPHYTETHWPSPMSCFNLPKMLCNPLSISIMAQHVRESLGSPMSSDTAYLSGIVVSITSYALQRKTNSLSLLISKEA